MGACEFALGAARGRCLAACVVSSKPVIFIVAVLVLLALVTGGLVWRKSGQHRQRQTRTESSQEQHGRVPGPEDPDTLAGRISRASMLHIQGRQAEAEQEYRAVLAVQERVLGPEHPDTLWSRKNLAAALG